MLYIISIFQIRMFGYVLTFQTRLRVLLSNPNELIINSLGFLVFMSSLRPQIRRFVDPSVFQKSFHQLSRTLLTHLNRPSVAISIRIQT